ncbi:MAG: ketoacyl-ACP synthase III [Pirellulales bacterium]|nr:ketoacyl-ACP synthase III [Pirellulales bacterium]
MQFRRVTGVQIVGTGSYVPDPVITNEDLADLGCDPEWILQRTGIRERRHAPPEMATSDIAVIAAERCIQKAGVDRRDIDLLLMATISPDYWMPSTACAVQERLKLHCGAMDIVAACAGFLYSLITAAHFVAMGGSKLALVIAADTSSRIMNPEDKHTYPLFGDGGGAVLLAPGDEDQGLLSFAFGSDGSGEQYLVRPAGGSRLPLQQDHFASGMHYLKMDGRPVFKWAVRLLSEVFHRIIEGTDLTVSDIDLWIPHQANARIIDAAAQDLGVDHSRIVMHIDRYGNTSAASIPIALDESLRDGRIRRGTTIATAGFGAGLVWGASLLKW